MVSCSQQPVILLTKHMVVDKLFILAAVVFNVVCVVTCLTWQAFAKLDDFAPKYQWLVITKMTN